MRVFLTILSIAFSVTARGATGDIVNNGNITDIGVAEIYVEGFPTNMVFNNGFLNVTNYSGTNEIWVQVPSTTNGLRVTLNSWGWYYGTNYVWPRTVYGTKLARKPYPDHAQSAVQTNGGAPNIARASLWLSDFIYTTDSNALAFITTNAFASNAAIASLSLTNGSTMQPWTPKCNSVNWGWENVTATTWTSRIWAADHYKIDGVSVILTHTNGQTLSNYTMLRTPDIKFTRGQNHAVFKNEFDLSSWTAAVFTVDYVVRPRIGTPFSTYDNLYPGDMPQPQRLTNLYNPGGNLTTYISVVDAGAVGPGAVTNVAPALVAPEHYFTNGAVASQRAASTNGNRGATVYWREGTTNAGPTSVNYARDVDSRIVWRPFPGHSFTLLTNTAGGGINPGGRLLIEDCTIRVNGTTTTLIDNCERLALSNCVIDSVAFPFRASSVNCIIFAEACKFTRLGGGIKGFSTDKLAWNLVGNDLNGFTNLWVPWLAIGNFHTNAAGTNFTIDHGPSFLPFPPQQRIFAHNILKGMWGDSTFVGEFGDNVYATTNDAVVGNLMEAIAPVGGAAKSLTFWASPTNMTGIIFHNNGIFGFRHQFGYNETGKGWKQISTKNNSVDVFGWVTDAIGGANNGNYTNNWWVMNGVGAVGNVIPNTSEVFHGDAEYFNFRNYFRPSASAKPYGWWRVVDRKALSSTTVYGAGNGDYHFFSDSPVWFVPHDPLYEFDLECVPMATAEDFDTAGALQSGNARKGDFL